MHRSTFPNNLPPANSPPLHHPVPQHVSTVPQLRSPPPAVPQQPGQQQYGYGGQPQPGQPAPGPQGGGAPGGDFGHPAFGNFINDSTAQMGLQFGRTAAMAGQEYVDKNFGRFIRVQQLKRYFDVSNSYVINKLLLVLFPWRHRGWVRSRGVPNGGQQEPPFLTPREDINSPDLYIPLYVALSPLSVVC
jgi:hypothetical protein